MHHEDENLSAFLKDVESSARTILRKNNEIRCHHNQIESNSNKCSSKKNFSIQDSSKARKEPNTKANKSASLDHTNFKFDNNPLGVQCISSGRSDENILRDIVNDSDTELKSEYLRNRYRNVSSWEEEESCDSIDESVHPNPLKELLGKHIADSRCSMNNMTAKRLSKFDDHVYHETVATLEKLQAKCLQEDEDFILESSSQHWLDKDSCMDEDTQLYEENRQPLIPKPSSRIISKLPPSRWPLAISEPISLFGEFSFVSIHRYCDKDHKEVEPLFTIDFHNSTLQRASRKILYERDMEAVSSFAENSFKLASPVYEICPSDDVLREWHVVYAAQNPEILKDYEFSHNHLISMRVGSTKCVCITPLIVRISLESTNQDGKSTILTSTDVPTNVIIAVIGLFHVVASSDVSFWTSNENAETVWEPLMKHLEVEEVSFAEALYESHEISNSYRYTKVQRRVTLQLKYSDDLSETDSLNWSGMYRNCDYEELMRALQFSNNVIHTFSQKTGHRNELLKSIEDAHKFEEESKLKSIERMDLDLRLLPPQAVRLSGRLALSSGLIPGVCSLPNDLNDDAMNHPLTKSNCFSGAQIAISLDRNIKDNYPLTVTTRVVLQSPVEAPIYKMFDPKPRFPPVTQVQEIDDQVPMEVAKANSIMNESIDVLNEDRYPSSVILIDPLSLDPNARSIMDTYPTDFNNETSKFYSKYGFRSKCSAETFIEKKSFPIHKFGMSEASITANTPTTHKSQILPSTEICDYLLSEERNMSDFMHLIRNPSCNKDGGYQSTPMISLIHMNAYKVGTVEGIKMDDYLAKQERKQRAEEEAKKQETVSNKIKAAKNILRQKLPLVFDFQKEEDPEKVAQLEPIGAGVRPDQKSVMGLRWRKLDDYFNSFVDSFDFRKPLLSKNMGNVSLATLNTPSVCDIVNPMDSVSYLLDEESIFQTPLRTKFVTNILEYRLDLAQKIYEEHCVKQIILSADQEVALDHIMRVPLEVGSITNHNASVLLDIKTEIESHNFAPKNEVDSLDDELKLVLATRHSDYNTMVHLLDEIGLNVDTCDEHGNSLLILAGQQGSKKLCKFLLRRGAYLNTQNHLGNTVLHYLYEYGHAELAEYLIHKGADDSILNGDGLTCFEGTSRLKLETL